MAYPLNPGPLPGGGHLIHIPTGLSPGVIVPPNTLPGDVKRGTKRGVIASVDNANTPKYATVLIDNHLPGESGYSIPLGWGPFAAGGTSGFNYFYNNSSGIGGSWVVVDADRRIILSLDQGVSTTAATPFYKAITDHLHSGNLNTDGYTNPRPVDLSSGESQNQLPYTQHASAMQSVISSTARILSNIISGGQVDSDGAIVSANGKQTKQTYPLVAGQPFTVSASILNGSPGSAITGIVLGDTTNGYGLIWDTNANQYITKYTGGVLTVLTTTAFVPYDNNYHSYRLSVVPGTPNSIEASIDTARFTASDSALALDGAAWYVTTFTG